MLHAGAMMRRRISWCLVVASKRRELPWRRRYTRCWWDLARTTTGRAAQDAQARRQGLPRWHPRSPRCLSIGKSTRHASLTSVVVAGSLSREWPCPELWQGGRLGTCYLFGL